MDVWYAPFVRLSGGRRTCALSDYGDGPGVFDLCTPFVRCGRARVCACPRFDFGGIDIIAPFADDGHWQAGAARARFYSAGGINISAFES